MTFHSHQDETAEWLNYLQPEGLVVGANVLRERGVTPIRQTALDLPHPLEAIANAYRLTPAEMRVLMMIVQIGGVPEIAPVLGISETTVKTHLQHVYKKTGTQRQADLVKLVAGYMSPLTG